MLDHEMPVRLKPMDASRPGQPRAILRYPIVTAGDVVPIFPNAIATIVGFVFLMIAPGLLLWFAEWMTDENLPIIEIGPFWSTGTLILTTIVSLGAASLFLVIGLILQFWHYHKPFAMWLPVALAFPVAWGLVLPEYWVRGGPMFYWIFLGFLIALAFSVQWMVLVGARDSMDQRRAAEPDERSLWPDDGLIE